jgi:hypothetical protein
MIAEASQPEPKKFASKKQPRGKPFTKGGPGGPGNPFLGEIQKYRSMMYKCITSEDFKRVVKKLIATANTGEGWAIKELLDRVLGKAQQPIDLQADGANVTYEFTLKIGENEING